MQLFVADPGLKLGYLRHFRMTGYGDENLLGTSRLDATAAKFIHPAAADYCDATYPDVAGLMVGTQIKAESRGASVMTVEATAKG